MDLTRFGGKLYQPRTSRVLYAAMGDVWDFGYIPEWDRTPEQLQAHQNAVNAMPKFGITGKTNYDTKKVCLTDTWKHPDVVAALGSPFQGILQKTGCCVGAGGGTMAFSLQAVEITQKGDAEKIIYPYWLVPYGRSRYYMGERSPGDGSTGSTFAKAAKEDGFLDARMEGLPKWSTEDGMWTYGESTEYKWSDGGAIDEKWLTASRKHLVKTVSQCRSADDVREAIVNGYPCTCASMWGCTSPRVQGTPAVLLGKRNTSWAHQMSLQAWWEHPELGEIYWLQNQWGQSAHGKCPTGMPLGGMWIPKSEVDWICRDEVFAFSNYEGYPAQKLNWLI